MKKLKQNKIKYPKLKTFIHKPKAYWLYEFQFVLKSGKVLTMNTVYHKPDKEDKVYSMWLKKTNFLTGNREELIWIGSRDDEVISRKDVKEIWVQCSDITEFTGLKGGKNV